MLGLPAVLPSGGAAKVVAPLPGLLPPRDTKAAGKSRSIRTETGPLAPQPPALDGGVPRYPACLNAVSSLPAASADLPHQLDNGPFGQRELTEPAEAHRGSPVPVLKGVVTEIVGAAVAGGGVS